MDLIAFGTLILLLSSNISQDSVSFALIQGYSYLESYQSFSNKQLILEFLESFFLLVKQVSQGSKRLNSIFKPLETCYMEFALPF
jgi:hypothetical protein